MGNGFTRPYSVDNNTQKANHESQNSTNKSTDFKTAMNSFQNNSYNNSDSSISNGKKVKSFLTGEKSQVNLNEYWAKMLCATN